MFEFKNLCYEKNSSCQKVIKVTKLKGVSVYKKFVVCCDSWNLKKKIKPVNKLTLLGFEFISNPKSKVIKENDINLSKINLFRSYFFMYTLWIHFNTCTN